MTDRPRRRIVRRGGVVRRGLGDAASLLRRTPVIGAFARALAGITPLGWSVALVGGLAVLAGLRWSWPELLVPGAGALVLVAGAFVLSFAPTSSTVELRLLRDRVVAGEDAVGELVIGNPSPRGMRPVLVEFLMEDSTVSRWSPRVEAKGTHTDPFVVLTRRRGRRAVGPARIVRGDLLGLVRRVRAQSEALDLRVHPRSVPLPFDAVGPVKDLDGVATQDLSSADVAFRSLRDYVPGDDRRNVHWRTSARVGHVVVREFEESRRSHLLQVLDLDEQAWTGESAFEDGVAVVASLARAALAESVEVALRTHAGTVNSTTSRAVLDALTEVEMEPVVRTLSEVVHLAVACVPGASVLVLVTGGARSVTSLHSLLSDLPPTVVPVVVRCVPGAESTTRTVGGLSVITLGALDDLAAMVRRIGR
ncbi:DUF58 domain-containing protein [Schaalia sp. 19OD2882]|uniref:DUF58 domain-containing protein n=1 Tax=Schaalia sp. 19OD2882 TaxID=2794089 RepID=UPI001C1EB364|nr:DUF58 domain-containing protein [Schaalia sp. 19OD2882]QWW19164.1 DUF58 domain-containing protein [Schaalia sp. 19OD2882]